MNPIPHEIISKIKRGHIEFVRFTWCDSSGIVVTKAVRSSVILDTHDKFIVQFPKPQRSDRVHRGHDLYKSSYFSQGDLSLIPDWYSFIELPYAKGHAKVFCDVYDGSKPWRHCPRTFLKQMIQKAENAGLSFQIAFENEFYLGHRTQNSLNPIDKSFYAQSYALDAIYPIITKLSDAFIKQRIIPESVHAESGQGQFEISIRHQDTLKAADQQVTFRETVRAVTQNQGGIIASFLPKIFYDQAGNGAHIHLSIWKKGRNITQDSKTPSTLSNTSAAFTAGLLSHLPALACASAPTSNSYRRIKPGSWSGAYVCWGYDNREAAIRIPRNSMTRHIRHLEYKVADPTCNPYIALGCIIAAGLDGISHSMKLDPSIEVNPADMTFFERFRCGIRPLPRTLGESIECFKTDEVLKQHLGADFFSSYIYVKEEEWLKKRDWRLEDEVNESLERF